MGVLVTVMHACSCTAVLALCEVMIWLQLCPAVCMSKVCLAADENKDTDQKHN
jgi:hypothetical protein